MLILLMLNFNAATLAAGAGQGPASVNEIASYQAQDRQARLVNAGKKEGEVSIYHSIPIDDMTVITAAFTKKYGIKVKLWRSGSETVTQRVATEARGGRFEVDIVENNSQANEALHRERLLQEVRSPYLKDLIPAAIPAHKEWVGTTIDVWVAAYNTDKIKKEELPKTFQDLLDPKWKGRVSIESDNHAWFGTLTETMGERQAIKLFTDIASTNGISPRKGHSLLATLVGSGEVPLALTLYDWNVEKLKQKGAPVEWFPLSPVIAQFKTVAMLRKAPHPHAAVLFYDFMLNEGQALLAGRKLVPTSKKIETAAGKLSLKFIDPVRFLDMNDKWKKGWEEAIIKRAMPQ
jgi:iron(III) transport system substrate-binding protein